MGLGLYKIFGLIVNYINGSKVLEYFDEDNNFHFNKWDKNKGMIYRSKRYDERNKQNPLAYTSIIIDAFKD